MAKTALLLWLVGRSVRRERGWGNPECQQRITEVCPYIGGRTTEWIEYNTGIVGGAVQAQSMTTVIEGNAVECTQGVDGGTC
jgi:hypothetical protein